MLVVAIRIGLAYSSAHPRGGRSTFLSAFYGDKRNGATNGNGSNVAAQEGIVGGVLLGLQPVEFSTELNGRLPQSVVAIASLPSSVSVVFVMNEVEGRQK